MDSVLSIFLFSIQSIQYTNAPAWLTLDLQTATGVRALKNLYSITHNTDGIELYYIHMIQGPMVALTSKGGIVISHDANDKTLAHEIGHACNLRDIYDSASESYFEITGLVKKEYCQDDWPSGTEESYYQENIELASILPRFLMYGYEGDLRSDISSGDVKGIWYSNEYNPVHEEYETNWHTNAAPIGFYIHGTRSPVSQ